MRCGGLDKNIAEAIKGAMADGIVAMSIDNLKQITSTRGIVMHRMVYNRVFPEIAEIVAKDMNFTILQEGEHYGIT